jgi:hypothetical protein
MEGGNKSPKTPAPTTPATWQPDVEVEEPLASLEKPRLAHLEQQLEFLREERREMARLVQRLREREREREGWREEGGERERRDQG